MTLPNPRAIVLEYNPAAMRALERALHGLDFAVAPTTDPAQALAWLQRHRPHVVFVDFGMPKMSGAEFLTLARQTHCGAEVPIVATGDSIVVELPEGTVAWLSRPVREADLLHVLEVALAETPEGKEAEATAEANKVPRRAVTTAAYRKPGGPRLTIFRDSGRISVAIESCVENGMRTRSAMELDLGAGLEGQIDWIDPARGAARSGRIKLSMRVDSVTETDDGWTCGLAVLEAKPLQWWRRFVAAESGGD